MLPFLLLSFSFIWQIWHLLTRNTVDFFFFSIVLVQLHDPDSGILRCEQRKLFLSDLLQGFSYFAFDCICFPSHLFSYMLGGILQGQISASPCWLSVIEKENKILKVTLYHTRTYSNIMCPSSFLVLLHTTDI